MANSGPFRITVTRIDVKHKKSKAEMWRIIATAFLHVDEEKKSAQKN